MRDTHSASTPWPQQQQQNLDSSSSTTSCVAKKSRITILAANFKHIASLLGTLTSTRPATAAHPYLVVLGAVVSLHVRQQCLRSQQPTGALQEGDLGRLQCGVAGVSIAKR
jgi:hypothetical protein